MVEYKRNPSKSIFTIMDRVDTIKGPALVIPASINHKDYIQIDNIQRSEIEFYSIPFEFLCRDDWADIHAQGEAAKTDTGIDTQIFENASMQTKQDMIEEIHMYVYSTAADTMEIEEEMVESDDDDDDSSDGSSDSSDEDEETDSDEDDDNGGRAQKILQKYNLRKRAA